MIINGTLEWPVRWFHKVQRVLVQFTPSYVGNIKALQLVTRTLYFWKTKLWTGGGFLASFAFGSKGPSANPGPWLKMPKPNTPFSIWHASGISSSAYGYEAARYKMKFPIPKMTYWAVKNSCDSDKTAARQYFTDGGNLENFGIMAMLQRKVKRLIVFVDSETVLPKTADHVMTNSDLTPLFGLNNAGMPNNQVFQKDDYHRF